MTDMPKDVYIFPDPKSIGDKGFATDYPKVTLDGEPYTHYVRNDISMDKLNEIYSERMIVVCMLAKMSGCNYGLGKDDNVDWEDEWRNVVYIDLPEGQVSWHIAPQDMHMFDDFPAYQGKWDGTFNGRSAEFAKSVKALTAIEQARGEG